MKLIVEKPSPLATTDLVACEIVRGKDFGCVWHRHPECEIVLVKRGGTERLVGDKLTPLEPGDLTFMGSDVPHDFRNEPRPGIRTKAVEAIVVQFMPNLLGEEWLHYPPMEPIRQLFDRAQLGVVVNGQTRRKLVRHMNRIANSNGVTRVATLLQMLEEMAKSDELQEIASPGFHASVGDSSADRIGKVCAFIEKNLSEPIYVTDLARMIGLSESAFSRLFKKATGRTVPQYTNEMRVAHACRLLAETDLTVGEIAADCGYPSLANFQRQFRRQQNRSPLVYRSDVRRVR